MVLFKIGRRLFKLNSKDDSIGKQTEIKRRASQKITEEDQLRKESEERGVKSRKKMLENLPVDIRERLGAEERVEEKKEEKQLEKIKGLIEAM